MELADKLKHPRQHIRVGKYPIQRFLERVDPTLNKSQAIAAIDALLRGEILKLKPANKPADYKVKVRYKDYKLWIILEVASFPELADIKVYTIYHARESPGYVPESLIQSFN